MSFSDAQGNSFDPHVVLLRLQVGIRMWSCGDTMARHVYIGFAAVRGAYAVVLDYVRGRGLVGAEHPFPHDLRECLMGLELDTQFSHTPGALHNRSDGPLPAEHGRDDQ